MTVRTFLLCLTFFLNLFSRVQSLFFGPRLCRLKCELYLLTNYDSFIKDEFISATGPVFRDIENRNNNLKNPKWGTPEDELLRKDDSMFAYSDGISTLSGKDRPNERVISNTIFSQEGEILSSRSLSNLAWQFGQFVDHDLTLIEETHEEPISVQVPLGDDPFDLNKTGSVRIRTFRTIAANGTGNNTSKPRNQFNAETAFLDGSQVYGSTYERSEALRTHENGLLKVNPDFTEGRFDHLPFNEDGIPNAGGPFSDLLIAGDLRVNEQIGLAALHTLFLREHNRLASLIGLLNPYFSDEDIYQRARAINIAVLQHITMNEFYESITGRSIRLIPESRDVYDEDVSVQMTASFSAFAFRVGHTMLPDELPRLDQNLDPIQDGPVSLRDAFFRPEFILEDGISNLLRGLANTIQSKIDTAVVDGVRNFLFESADPGQFTFPLDLVSLNLLRGRDFGLPDYNTVRRAYGLESNDDLKNITSDDDLLEKLKILYDGKEDLIDPFVGALAEDHLEDSSLGELLSVIWEDQFTRLRSGDRFYYTRYFKGDMLEYIRSMTLRKIIILNTNIHSRQILSDNAFFATE